MITFLAAIFVFGLIIISHELGHFVTAKSFGVGILEFSVGMGPKLAGFKKNGTSYSLRLFPLGGYVKMLGEDGCSSESNAFCNQNPWKRLVIVVAGAFMNFVIAILLLSLIFYNTGIYKPIVGSLEKNYPAEKVGIQLNDTIIGLNGVKIKSWDDFIEFISKDKDKEFNMTLERNGKIINKTIKPEYISSENRYMVGIAPTIVKGNFFESVGEGFSKTGNVIKSIVLFLGGIFKGKFSSNDVGGPVAIIKLSGEVAKLGIWNLLMFAAYLSINLGIINLIPFPALDGGWVFILLIEGVTGKKISEDKIGLVNLIGFAILIGFSIFITYKDILKLTFN